jgi:hypothetical protein
MAAPMKLSPEREAELLNELRLRVLFSDRALCRRYGISRRTLVRLQSKALDPYAEGLVCVRARIEAQLAPDTSAPVCFATDGTAKAEAA